nr:hypothetical protein [Rubripirellula sp.]
MRHPEFYFSDQEQLVQPARTRHYDTQFLPITIAIEQNVTETCLLTPLQKTPP